MNEPFQALPMDDPVLAGQKIRTERLRRGLTQSDMGEMLGLSTSYISSLERGQRRISWNVGRKLHQCFGISCDYMMEGGSNISSFENTLRESEEAELFHRFKVLLGTCTDQELFICYQMCRCFISSARQAAVAAASGMRTSVVPSADAPQPAVSSGKPEADA